MASMQPPPSSTTQPQGNSVHLSYSLMPPFGSPAPVDPKTNTYLNPNSSLTVPLTVPLSSTQGAPSSSRESDTAYLKALGDSIDEMKAQVMAHMSAWKDTVGKFEDMESRRLGSRNVGQNMTNRQSTNNEEDEEDDDDDDEEDEEEEQ
ncbi:unnamed protein product [Sympodiomycopsis kandeliae]